LAIVSILRNGATGVLSNAREHDRPRGDHTPIVVRACV